MEQENKIGFFGQYIIALTKPSRYKELLKKNSRSRVCYVLLLALVLFILKTGIHFIAWDMSVGGIKNLVMNGLPSFTFSNGILTTEYPVDMTFNNELRILIDSNVEQYETKDIEEYGVIGTETSDTMDITTKYYDVILISKNNAVMKLGSRLFILDFSDFKNVTLDNSVLTQYLSVAKVIIGITFLLSYLVEIGGYLLMSALYALIGRMRIRGESTRLLSFHDAFCFAVYAKTLFALLGAVNASLGYFIPIEIQYIVAVFVTMTFMIKAQIAMFKDNHDMPDHQGGL